MHHYPKIEWMSRSLIIPVLLVSFLLVACGGSKATISKTYPAPITYSSGLKANLDIAYTPHNNINTVHHYTLTCNPVGGTLPSKQAACKELAYSAHYLTGSVGVCPLLVILGAPTTTVQGTINGKPVHRTVTPVCPTGAYTALHFVLTGK